MKKSYYYIFPFGQVEKGQNIILWGFGVVGKQYIEQIRKTNYCNVLFAVDKNWKDQEKSNEVIVKEPEVIKEYANVKIVIAVSSKQLFEEIKQTIIKWNIAEEKIIYDCKVCEQLVVEEQKRLERVALSIESILLDSKNNNKNISLLEWNHFKNIHTLLYTMTVKNRNLVRLGNQNDGGYVMVNNFISKGGIAYSFGISSDVSWDKAIAKLGYDVYMYDHTIDKLPEENDKFHFFKMGIAKKQSEIGDTLNTLEHFIAENNHENKNKMILKMDVEGAEYGFFEMTDNSTIKKFDQIVLELHRIIDYNMTDQILDTLRKLNITHQLVHIHGNNYSRVKYINNCPFSDSIEVLYLKRDEYQFEKEENISRPFEIDAPCWKERDEIILGNWNEYVI